MTDLDLNELERLEKAAPTALASSDPEGHLQAMSDAELPAPASPGMVSVPREELEWIARQYDDGRPSYELASRLYDVSCTARAMIAAAEEGRSRG